MILLVEGKSPRGYAGSPVIAHAHETVRPGKDD